MLIVAMFRWMALAGIRDASPEKSHTASTAASSASMVTMTSAPRSSSASAAMRAPCCASGSAAARVRLYTVSACPAPSSRCTIGRPICPSPAKPTFIARSSVRGDSHRLDEPRETPDLRGDEAAGLLGRSDERDERLRLELVAHVLGLQSLL